jgi:Na+/proline symporter
MNEDRLRKWVFIALGVLCAAQLYFVQELFAALLLFGVIFLAVAIFSALIFLTHEGGQRAVAWVEVQRRAAHAIFMRTFAFASAVSKKPSPRPH